MNGIVFPVYLPARPRSLANVNTVVFIEELTRHDHATRNWALGEPDIRLKVKRSDKHRLNYVKKLFQVCGFDEEAAELRAGIFVSEASREETLFGRLPQKDRLKRGIIFRPAGRPGARRTGRHYSDYAGDGNREDVNMTNIRSLYY